MNPRLGLLQPYAFEKLRWLLEGIRPPDGLTPISLSVGEPQHPTPAVIKDAVTANLHLLGKYPPTQGTPEIRSAISNWIGRRYGVTPPDPDREVLPVAGSREALFAFAQAVLDPADPGIVLLPNPFYMIYEGAALLAGAEPFYVPTPRDKGFLPDWGAVPAHVWPRVRLVYACSPGNPAGAVMGLEEWRELFALADRYGFVIAADECYSEIFCGPELGLDEGSIGEPHFGGGPPTGALEAAARLSFGGKVVSFNSLSKRSSAPGLRSGFVAGHAEVIQKFLAYRTYHGAAPSLLTQVASVAAWSDEDHVLENRAKYRAKFQAASRILPEARVPEGGFFLWLEVDDDEAFAKRALAEQGVTVLPGRYLGRDVCGKNPGAGYVRIALVAEPDVCAEALERLSKISC